MEGVCFSWDEVISIIKIFMCNRSAGSKSIYSRVLHTEVNELAYLISLYIIFNESIHCSEILDEYKLANVGPIFEKGKKDEVENYRSVSLTPEVNKALEKLTKNRLLSF